MRMIHKKHSRRRLLICLLSFLSLGPGRLFSQQKLPFNDELRNQIHRHFYHERRVSPEKIEIYRNRMVNRFREFEQNLDRHYQSERGYSAKKSRKEIQEVSEIQAYHILLDLIDRLGMIQDPVAFDRMAAAILELDYSLKISGHKLRSSIVVERLGLSLKVPRIYRYGARHGEASNLVDPEDGLFFSQKELRRYVIQGGDISKLNPPADSTFWRPQSVPRIDVKSFYQNGKYRLHDGLEFHFPEKKAYFKKFRFTQSRPKLDVRTKYKGKNLNFKLKVASETHSEITAASLYATLGFSVDNCRHVRNFKVVLGEMTPVDFRNGWNAYFHSWDIDKYIKALGEDDEGHYIVFYEAVLEAKPDELIRVGAWDWTRNGHGGLREVRGSMVFDIWIGNVDMKQSENNKLILRKINGVYRFFHIQHDLGYAFGGRITEKVASFPWNIIKASGDEAIIFNFAAFYKNDIYKYPTFSDARWMACLIARLTRAQIAAAVELGCWPESVGRLLVEKLIYRRNQLVEAFNLEGDITEEGTRIELLECSRRLTTPDGIIVNGRLKTSEFPGYTMDFGHEIQEALQGVFLEIRKVFAKNTSKLLHSIHYLELDPEWFGLEEGLISRIIVRFNREMELNPYPESRNDQYLVKDTLEVGLELGYGATVSGDVSYVKTYTLAYPVASEIEGRYHRGFIVDLGLPRRLGGGNVPNDFVMMLEDSLRLRGRIKIEPGEAVSLVNDFEAARITLGRSVLSRKHGDRLDYFQDESQWHQLGYKFGLKLLYILRFRILDEGLRCGALNRDYTRLDISDLESNSQKQEALEHLILAGDASRLERLGKRYFLHDRFTERRSDFDFFGLLRQRTIRRVDKVELTELEEAVPRAYFQIEDQRLRLWSFIDNGERYFSSLRMTGQLNEFGAVERSVLDIRLKIEDKLTRNRELKNGYLNMINTLALEPRFLAFDPTQHTINHIWGPLVVTVDLMLYQEALTDLLEVEDTDIWEALEEVSGISSEEWKRKARPRYDRGRRSYPHDHKRAYLARKALYFERELRVARRLEDSTQQLKSLVKAIRKTVYLSEGTFQPILLAVLHKLVGSEHLYLKTSITMPPNRENMLPGKVPIGRELGVKQPYDYPIFQFVFEDPAEFYHLF